MKTRGLGFVFQTKYRDAKTGETKTGATWSISYSVRGVRRRESVHSTNRADAVRLLKTRISEVAQGRPTGSQVERTTLADLLGMVEADYVANGRRTSRRVRDSGAHLREFFGDCKANEITSDRITAYVAHRLSEKAAKATCNIEQAILRRGFHLAAKAGKVSSTPAMSMLHLDNARTGFLEREQLDAIVQYLPNHLKALIRVGYLTGWRKGELLSRQWRHIDLKQGWLRLEVGETKNGKGRAFPIHALPELDALLKAQRERVSVIERETDAIIPWVFCNDDGSPIRSFSRSWSAACRRAGAPGRLFHDMRRGAVRAFERAGVSRSAGMALSGHLTASIYTRYSIVDSKTLVEAVEKLASANVRSAAESKSPNRDQTGAPVLRPTLKSL
jgi:integrase